MTRKGEGSSQTINYGGVVSVNYVWKDISELEPIEYSKCGKEYLYSHES